MKLEKYQILILATLVGLIMWSCKKEDITIDIKSGSWEVLKMMKQGESSYTKAKESYVLEFVSDTMYSLKLDVNNCYGGYENERSGNVIIDVLGCTQVCCDSDFAEDLVQLLPKMTDYYGKGEKLIFEGEGEIILKKI